MAVPDRWRAPRLDPQEVARFSALCDRIEERRPGWEQDLATWNARAHAPYDFSDFVTYHASTDKETFVRKALQGDPRRFYDLTFLELVDVVRAVVEVECDEAEHDHLLSALDLNLPCASISDLIYWPNHWFGDRSARPAEFELTPELIVRYAVLRSRRSVAGCPDTPPLPYPPPAPGGPYELPMWPLMRPGAPDPIAP